MNVRPTRGFTLLEIMIVTVVVSVVLLGVFSTFNVADKARVFASERDLAREACRAKLEELTDLAATSYGSVATSHGTFFDVPEAPSPTGERLVSSVPGELPGRILISTQANPAHAPLDSTPARPNLMKITVQVRWLGHETDQSSPTGSMIEMSALVASGR